MQKELLVSTIVCALLIAVVFACLPHARQGAVDRDRQALKADTFDQAVALLKDRGEIGVTFHNGLEKQVGPKEGQVFANLPDKIVLPDKTVIYRLPANGDWINLYCKGEPDMSTAGWPGVITEWSDRKDPHSRLTNCHRGYCLPFIYGPEDFIGKPLIDTKMPKIGEHGQAFYFIDTSCGEAYQHLDVVMLSNSMNSVMTIENKDFEPENMAINQKFYIAGQYGKITKIDGRKIFVTIDHPADITRE